MQVNLLIDSSFPTETLQALSNLYLTCNPGFPSESHMKAKTVELIETEHVHLL